MSASDSIDPIQVLRTLAARWRVISVCVAVFLALAVAAALLSTPTYRSEALLSFNDERTSGLGLAGAGSQLGGLASLAGINIDGSQSQKDIAIALMSSRGFLEPFISENHLLPVLYASRWDAQSKSWLKKPPTISDGVELFRKRLLTVNEDRRTGLVRVAIEWRDREVAARWVNDLVRRVNEVTRTWAIEDARSSRKYLDAALEKTGIVELRESMHRLLEGELKKEMVASVRLQYSFRVIDPAMPSDAEDFVRPRRALLVAFGLFSGFIFGCALALALNAWQRRANPPA
jgi:uncharacterized protein involved in exopolysaccharide biosynthesis